ncbi:hypothetical protein ACH5RR_018316 [Cinchona calisaya]|uniref:Uncharacterized protein n=1 Tax=Cinchona calisaya TaxID=153742 RepID=A0ABD2ZL42_9GENT
MEKLNSKENHINELVVDTLEDMKLFTKWTENAGVSAALVVNIVVNEIEAIDSSNLEDDVDVFSWVQKLLDNMAESEAVAGQTSSLINSYMQNPASAIIGTT